jgi:hypothetical protein
MAAETLKLAGGNARGIDDAMAVMYGYDEYRMF